MQRRTLVLTTAALATALTLTGCSGSESSGGTSGTDRSSTPTSTPSAQSSSAEFNDADIAFAQNMIPHHQGAIEMSDVILAKEGIDQRVIDLANQIKEAQGPEIEQLQTLLTEWGAEDRSGMGHDMDGMGHDMDGMDADMSDIEAATGVEAARMFLEQMKVHHQGAITMAQTEIDTGADPDAIDLAEAIVTTQTEEIATIDSILASL